MPNYEFYGFQSPSKNEWLNRINKDLKGKDFETYLTTEFAHNVKMSALQFPGDTRDVQKDIGVYPHTRGTKDGNAYRIEQSFDVTHEENANKDILDALVSGVSSVGLQCVTDQTNFNKLLKQVESRFICIGLKGNHNIAAVNHFLQQNFPYTFLGIDPFSNDSNLSIQESIELVKQNFKEQSNQYFYGIKGIDIANSGGSIVTELAYILSSGHEILLSLLKSGFNLEQVSTMLSFQLGLGPSYYLNIAKVRAIRLLWSNLLKAYNPEYAQSATIWIHGETILWNKLNIDKDTNILRATTEGISGILGGVNSLEINHQNIGEKELSDQYRVTRNLHHLCCEESYLNLVSDPLGGSYAIEALTKQLANKSWELFKGVEEAGGLTKKTDIFKMYTKEDQAHLMSRIKSDQKVFIGGNKFGLKDHEFNLEKDLNIKDV